MIHAMRLVILPIVAAFFAACSPALDWREVRPPGAAALLLFPCKVHSETRPVRLGIGTVAMTLSACDAGDTTFALAHADVVDPSSVGAALDGLARAAAANVGATVGGEGEPLQVDGMTPHPAARHWRFEGRRPDGRLVQERVAVFSRGTRVYQVTMLGEALDDGAAQTFFDSLQLGR